LDSGKKHSYGCQQSGCVRWLTGYLCSALQTCVLPLPRPYANILRGRYRRLHYLPLGDRSRSRIFRCLELVELGAFIRPSSADLTSKLLFASIGKLVEPRGPATIGSRAARNVEPRQVREEAALRRTPRVPWITW